MKRLLITALLILMVVPGCSKSQVEGLIAWAAKRAVVFVAHRLVDAVVDGDSSDESVREAPSGSTTDGPREVEGERRCRDFPSEPDSCTGEPL